AEEPVRRERHLILLLAASLVGCAPADPGVTGTVSRFGQPWATAVVTRRGDEVTWTFTHAGLPPTVVVARLDADGTLATWRSATGDVERAALRRTADGYLWST